MFQYLHRTLALYLNSFQQILSSLRMLAHKIKSKRANFTSVTQFAIKAFKCTPKHVKLNYAQRLFHSVLSLPRQSNLTLEK